MTKPTPETPLHIRDMVPAEDELMSSDEIAYTQLYELRKGKLVATAQYMHWDPEHAVAVYGPKPAEGEMVPTGGKIAVDTLCHDCGAHLQAGHKWPTPKSEGTYYLICARLVSDGFAGYMPEPYPDSVIECGNWQPTEPEPVLVEA